MPPDLPADEHSQAADRRSSSLEPSTHAYHQPDFFEQPSPATGGFSAETGRDQGVALTSEPRLSPEEAELAGILLRLPRTKQERLLRLVQLPDLAARVRWQSAAEFKSSLDSSALQDWQKVLIGTASNGHQYFMSLRRDFEEVAGVFQSLLVRAGVLLEQLLPTTLQNEAGERVFAEFHTGTRLPEMKTAARKAFPTEQFDVLAYLLYADEAVVQLGGFKFHPLVIFLALPLAQLRRPGNHATIAYLPVVGKESGLSKTELRIFRRQIMMKAYKQALQPLKDLSYRIIELEVGSSAEQPRPHPFLCMPAAFVADQVEAWEVSNIRRLPAKYCDVQFLVPKDALHDPLAQHPERTLAATRKTLSEAKRRRSEEGTGAEERALKRMSIALPEMTPLHGFNGVDAFRLCHPDTLHQTDLGDVKKLIELTVRSFTDAEVSSLDEYVSRLPPSPLLKLPSGGIRAAMSTAAEQLSLFKVLPVALLEMAGETELATDVLMVMVACLNYILLRDMRGHTREALRGLKKARIRYQQRAVALLHRPGVLSCDNVKFFNHRKYEALIEEYGNVHVLSAGPGEASHKAVKEAYAHSNRQTAHALDQMAAHLRRVETAVSLARPLHARAGRSASAGQRALAGSVHELMGVRFSFTLAELAEPQEAGLISLLEAQPDMRELGDSLDAFLQDQLAECGAGATSLLHGKVALHRGFAMPARRHRGFREEAAILRANPSFGSNRREAYDFVAVRCSEDEESDDCFFVQLRAVLRCKTVAGACLELAYVRWLEADDPNELEDLLSFQKLRWEVGEHGGPSYGVIELQSILQPAYLQPHPLEDDVWFYNHAV